MKQPIELRFIPSWLGNVIDHYGTGHEDFDRIVSSHDLRLYKVANNLLQTHLRARLDITDFTFPDAALEGVFTEDDATFALFGNNPDRKAVSEFSLIHFKIVPDKGNGILVIACKGESTTEGPQCLVAELVKAIATYRGVEEAYQSVAFVRFLKNVNMYAKAPEIVLTVKGVEDYRLKQRSHLISDQPLLLGDPTPPLNT